MHCSYCRAENDHWMKDGEVIICPKLKAKKQKEKQKREQEKRDRALNNFYNPTTNKTAPVKHAQTSFAGMGLLMDQNEQNEAATQIQKIVRGCIAMAKVRYMLKTKEQEKQRKKSNKGKKGKKKNRGPSEKVYFEAPTDC